MTTSGRSGSSPTAVRARRPKCGATAGSRSSSHDLTDAFVTLIGKATPLEDASEDRKRWKRAYDAYFPTDADRTNAVFVEVDVERMELWIRGVTPEPFGLQATVLERDRADGWRLIAG